jgi:phosphatidylinositol-3,4,5-trisphosphate 3-phosphatase/dual-specificity protein phosphatase PTEN
MNYLRKIVSGKRRRFQDGQYDLDITYITSRIIAMSFPATGYIETTYRNPIHDVIHYIMLNKLYLIRL